MGRPSAPDLFAKIDEDGSGDLIADEVAELYKEVLGQSDEACLDRR